MRTEITVTLKNTYTYEALAFTYGYETRHIHKMITEDGTVYVWKTTTPLFIRVQVEQGGCEIDEKGRRWDMLPINPGDIIKIACTVKGEDEYRGEKQILINRVRVIDRIFKAKTPEEIAAEKKAEKETRKAEQMASIKGGDIVMKMTYKNYKEHYSDCETVIDSFERPRHGECTVKVIVREGRLKNSGNRGKRIKTYRFTIENDGKEFTRCYRAYGLGYAYARMCKEFPDAEAKEVEVFKFW